MSRDENQSKLFDPEELERTAEKLIRDVRSRYFKGDLTKEDLRQILLASLQAVAEERERVRKSLNEKAEAVEGDGEPKSEGN